MIKFCGCRTGSNTVKTGTGIVIKGVYTNSQAVIFQDSLYGKGQRVHTPLSGSRGSKYRCTVCGKEK